MNDCDKQFFSAGEFAKLFDISKQTLFYYEKNNIFAPAFTDENGYRYYSLEQYFLFEIIITLKKLGIPLQKIAFYVSHRSLDNLQQLFVEKKNEYARQIALLQKNTEKIETKINRLEQVKHIRIDRITLEHQAEEYLVVNEFPQTGLTAKDKIIHVAVHNLPFAANPLLNEYVMGYILSQKQLTTGKYQEIDRIFTQVSSLEEHTNAIIKPCGLYATIFKPQGYHSQYKDALQKLTAFIRRNELTITGDAYIFQLRNYWSTSNPQEYVSQISIPVDYEGKEE